MFFVSHLRDIVPIGPQSLGRDLTVAVSAEINKRYTDKVIHKLGLCICLFDVLEIGDSEVYPSDGSAHAQVSFRLLMFRPFLGEVVQGTVISMSKETGIRVGVGEFFNEVHIPPQRLQSGSWFDDASGEWKWSYQSHQLAYEKDGDIYFMVEREEFTDTARKTELESKASQTGTAGPPYRIWGKVNLAGLGMREWWDL